MDLDLNNKKWSGIVLMAFKAILIKHAFAKSRALFPLIRLRYIPWLLQCRMTWRI